MFEVIVGSATVWQRLSLVLQVPNADPQGAFVNPEHLYPCPAQEPKARSLQNTANEDDISREAQPYMLTAALRFFDPRCFEQLCMLLQPPSNQKLKSQASAGSFTNRADKAQSVGVGCGLFRGLCTGASLQAVAAASLQVWSKFA